MNEPDNQRPERPRMGKVTFLCWLAIFGGTAYVFYQKLDYVGMLGTAAIALACFSGFRLGASRITATLLGFAAAVAFAPGLGLTQEHRFTEWFGTTGLTNRFLSIGAIGLLLALTVTVISVLIMNRVMKHRPRLVWSNCWLGFLIGGAEGAVAILLLLGGILIMQPVEQQRADLRDPSDVRGLAVSNAILTVAQKTQASPIGPVVEKYNPFTRIPQLNKIEKIQSTVHVLSDPDRINGLLQHAAIRQLQQQPEVKVAVDRLMSDAEIKQILYSGKAIDRAAAITLLNHPAVLELVDQPGFLEEANKIIDESNLLESLQ
jgi:uncharacterized membrane protein required for colicin V production